MSRYMMKRPFSLWWFRKRFVYPRVHVCNSPSEWQLLQKQCIKPHAPIQVVGLDCEWVTVNTKRQPVALLQLAFPSDICILVRLCNFTSMGEGLPEGLIEMLSNQEILKVGVGIYDDAHKLLKDYGLHVKGTLDLRYMVDLMPELGSLKKKGLQGLAESVLGVKLEKGWRIACSDWSAKSLSDKQIEYSVMDATVSLWIFLDLMRRHESLDKSFFDKVWYTPPSLSQMTQKAKELFGSFLNRSYSVKGGTRTSEKGQSPCRFDQKRNLHTKAYSARTKPLYTNCQLQAPDGEVLCTCDRKKARWYIDKGLGVAISEEPLVVRIKFEPAGRPKDYDGMYYVQEKENMCVVCGKQDSFVRKNVVPHEYRKYFPSVMKDHLSHDVLLLCLDCHYLSNLHDCLLRERLAIECGAPIGTEEDVKARDDPELKKVKSAARALLLNKDKIPASRQRELLTVLRNYYKVDDVIEDVLNRAANLETSIPNASYVPHGLKVVRYKEEHGGLVAFESSWRKHFLATMKPKYLPKMWSVEHNHRRLQPIACNQHNTRDFH